MKFKLPFYVFLQIAFSNRAINVNVATRHT